MLVVFGAAFAATRLPLAGAGTVASKPVAHDQQPTASDIVIPVAGIARERLKPAFDQARAGHVHHALDIMAPRGTPVLAAVDGTIRKLFTSRGGGITIYEFDNDEQHVYYYAHLDRYADELREGMRVTRGMLIGYVGTTGNAPAGTPHLHFAIERLTPAKRWWEGDAIDPYPILMDRGVTLSAPVSTSLAAE